MDASMVVESVYLENGIKQIICNKLGIPELKIYQEAALFHICMERKDVIISAPTGSGKSVCFQAISPIRESACTQNQLNSFVLVVSPLRILMKKQADALNKLDS